MRTLSAAADLSAQLPPVGNQGSQGSCVAWATSSYYKSWSEKLEHTGWSLSNTRYEFSPSFMYNQINGGSDNGSSFPDAFDVLQQKGDVDIAEMPYNQSNCTTQPTASQLEAAKPYRIPAGWSYLWIQSGLGPFSRANDVVSAKSWLSQGKLLVMGIPVYYDFPDFGSSPSRAYYDYNGSSGFAGGHGVCICGYNDNINPGGVDADHRGGFKMVNSWGPYWNGSSSGYVWLSYDFVKRYVWEAWTMSDHAGDGPTIDHLSTNAGHAGASIDIVGNNFGTKRRSACVTVNGTAATQATFTNGKITATVPAGATSGPVVVYDWDGAASNSASFTVLDSGGGPTAPALSWISPGSGIRTTAVAISGSGFGARRDASVVKFASVSVPANYCVSWSDTSLVVRVPGGVGGKPIVTVTTPAGTSNGLVFKVVPQISTMSTTSGSPGTLVTINGQGFGSWSSGYTVVYFGTRRAVTYAGWSNNRIRVRVPSCTTSSVSVTVNTAGGTSSRKTFRVISGSGANPGWHTRPSSCFIQRSAFQAPGQGITRRAGANTVSVEPPGVSRLLAAGRMRRGRRALPRRAPNMPDPLAAPILSCIRRPAGRLPGPGRRDGFLPASLQP